MKLRTLIIVAVALAVVTLAGYYIRSASLTTPENDPLVGTQVVDQSILADVSRIEISKEDSEVILELDESGDWAVRSLFDLPADFGKLNTLIRNLVDAKIQRKITGREDRLARLDLNQGTIKLLSEAGTPLIEITFGKSLSGGGKAFVFGREKTAYLASTSPYIDASSNNWAVKTLYKFQADDVAGIQFSLTDESWGIRRDDKEKDFVSTLPADERTPKQSGITSLMNRFTNLRFVEVAERAAEESTQTWKDAQENARSLKFTLFSGETITIKMSQWDPPVPEDEEAPESTEPSVTYLEISSSQADHSINSLMDRLAFKASSYSFSGIPVEISEVADVPEPEPEEEEEEVSSADASELAQPPQEETDQLPQEETAQPEIIQHIDGNSIIFEVKPAKKKESVNTEEEVEQPDSGSGDSASSENP
ncbi:MAG: DUF4340 domain-containing protein [Verrucomicrobia bacterium]|nr:DUF4340 domain-containing protein [Verrucomicrobiota bacterium]